MVSIGADMVRRYYRNFCNNARRDDLGAIVITHVLPDRRLFLPALEEVVKIDRVIAIPYSTDPNVLSELNSSYSFVTPSLEDLKSKNYIIDCINSSSFPNVILLDIGGYFSFLGEGCMSALVRNIEGIIEDTESGHREYAKYQWDIPVVSVARSDLKIGEDALVGASTAFSLEAIFRQSGRIMGVNECLVLGFGKVGKGMALAMRQRNMKVSVYDTNPIRRIEALSMGFSVPGRPESLRRADIIIGATGSASVNIEDLSILKDNVCLISTSSKDVEFPVAAIRGGSYSVRSFEPVEKCRYQEKVINLFYGGRPLNFRDGAAMDAFLMLVQSEIIFSVAAIANGRQPLGLCSLDAEHRNLIAERWIEQFVDQMSGGLSWA